MLETVLLVWRSIRSVIRPRIHLSFCLFRRLLGLPPVHRRLITVLGPCLLSCDSLLTPVSIPKNQGRPSPLQTMMHFPPVSDSTPYFRKKMLDSVENFHNITFSNKTFRFSSAKISDGFFVIDCKFWIFPIFAVLVHFPLFWKKYYCPHTFANFPLIS